MQLTREKLYAHPQYEQQPSPEFPRDVLLGVREWVDEGVPTLTAHHLQGEGYQHHTDLIDAYLRKQGRPSLNDTANTGNSVFGSVEVDGVDRSPLLTVAEHRSRGPLPERVRFFLWLGGHVDPPYRDMDRLVAVRNTLIHFAAVAAMQTLPYDLDDVKVECFFKADELFWRNPQNLVVQGYSALRDELEHLPAPSIAE